MTVKLSSLKTDSVRERDGDWVDSLVIPGVRLKVRSINYPPFTVARDMLQQRLRRQAGGKPVANDTWITSHGRLYAEHILLDWEGFDEPFSAERARDLLTDSEYREFTQAVELAAAQIGQAQIEFIEDAEKN